MKREEIEAALDNLAPRHIQEAASGPPVKKSRRLFPSYWGAAAILIFCAAAVRLFGTSPTVAAYAQGTNVEITSAGAVMQTGTIRDDGSQTGHPLMFYLAGKDIESVRFSCKNQKIRFEDWTETREEFGAAQNFTVPYGPDPSEYYYLLIDWIPEETVEALRQKNTKIADLTPELKEDWIVMEIQFSNGKRTTKAISISLLDNGTFYAAFGDYRAAPDDEFLSRPDARPIPRDVLYGPDGE